MKPDSFRQRMDRTFAHQYFGNALFLVGSTVGIVVARIGDAIGCAEVGIVFGLVLGVLAGVAAEYTLHRNA